MPPFGEPDWAAPGNTTTTTSAAGVPSAGAQTTGNNTDSSVERSVEKHCCIR